MLESFVIHPKKCAVKGSLRPFGLTAMKRRLPVPWILVALMFAGITAELSVARADTITGVTNIQAGGYGGLYIGNRAPLEPSPSASARPGRIVLARHRPCSDPCNIITISSGSSGRSLFTAHPTMLSYEIESTWLRIVIGEVPHGDRSAAIRSQPSHRTLYQAANSMTHSTHTS